MTDASSSSVTSPLRLRSEIPLSEIRPSGRRAVDRLPSTQMHRDMRQVHGAGEAFGERVQLGVGQWRGLRIQRLGGLPDGDFMLSQA